MAKETFYFQHDFEPTADPKIQAMLGTYGAFGYGIFWRIIEMLHSNQEHKLPHKKYIIEAIAAQMLTDADKIENLIKSCIKDYELLTSDGQFFWSDRVNRNFQKRMEISKVRSDAGKKSAFVKQMSTSVEQKSTKERKEKEIKGKEKKEKKVKGMTTFPSLFEVVNYFTENGYTSASGERAFKFYNDADWVDSKGNKVINWKQKMQGVWFKEENKSQAQKERMLQR